MNRYYYTWKGTHKMKRKSISVILIMILFLLTVMTDVQSNKQTEAAVLATKIASMRVVVDGTVKNYSGMLSGGTLYYSAVDYKKIIATIKKKAPAKAATMIYKKTTYYSLEDACKKLNISYEFDPLMKDVYIWTFKSFGDDQASEINTAIHMGLVPKVLQGDYDKQITFQENASIIEALVNLVDKRKLKTLKKKIPKTFTSKAKMRRGHGMAVIAYTANALTYNQFNYNWGSLNQEIGTKCWDELGNLDWSLFSMINTDPNPIYNMDGSREDWSMIAGMYFYSFGRASILSGKTLFDYDNKNKSMHPDQALTRGAAILASLRLYESVSHVKEALTLQEAKIGNTKVITEDLIGKAAAMPNPTLEKLPYYAGLTYNNLASVDWYEEDIRKIAEWGFNYIRVRVEYESFFDEKVTKAWGGNIDKLDYLIAWGMNYGVHIDLQLTEYPGWRVLGVSEDTTSSAELDYFTNRSQQLKTLEIWKVLASRYKEVPNNALTFSINHEPFNRNLTTDSSPSQHTYQDIVKTVQEVCDVIHQIDKERILFTESGFSWELDYLPYAKDLPVVNTFKASQGDEFVYWNLITDYTNASGYLPTWPITYYKTNPYIYGERGVSDQKNMPLILQGSLPKDTAITIHVQQISGSGELVVTADGVEIKRTTLNPQVGVDGCTKKHPNSEVYEYGIKKSSVGGRSINFAESGKSIRFTLPANTKELKVSYQGQSAEWIQWSGIRAVLPASHGVERLYYTSASDNFKAGKGAIDECALKKTSEVIISARGELNNTPLPITIHSDLTYTTTKIENQQNKDTIRTGTLEWVNTAKQSGLKSILCNEFVTFRGNTSENLCNYMDDLLSVYNELGIGWVYFGAYNGTIYDSDTIFALQGPCNEFDVNLLKTLQKHQKVNER